jgi:hypothetical protein
MTKRTSSILINLIGLTLVAPAAIAAPGDGLNFRPTIGDYRINYGQAANSITMGSSGLGETMSTHIGNAMAQDPKAFCTDVGIGTTTTTNRFSNSQSDKGSSTNHKAGGLGGSYGFGLIEAKGSAGFEKSNSWDNRTASSGGSTSSRTQVGKDCTALLNNAAAIDMNRVDNETERLGILVGNETQRYDVDKRFQLGLKQIQAQQVVSVFGGGANAMMGSMGK